MIRINLLPFRATRKKENIRRQVSIYFLSIFLVLGLLWYANSRLINEIEGLNSKIATTQAALNQKRKEAKEVDEIQARIAVMQQKIDVIDGLKQDRETPVRLLDVMTKVVVQNRMWFTRMNEKTEAKEGFQITRVNITGIAVDNKTVADFMTRLESSGMFVSVDLKTLSQQRINDLNLKAFAVVCVKTPVAIQQQTVAKK